MAEPRLEIIEIIDAPFEIKEKDNLYLARLLQEKGLVSIQFVLDEKSGWSEHKQEHFDNLTLVGSCSFDGDIFFCKSQGRIQFFKGQLNSGLYLKKQ